MEAETATVILRGFHEHRLARAAVEDGTCRAWRWTAGTLRFPDAICPFCGAAMTSTRIWLVDEAMGRLYGQVRLAGGRLVKEPPRHPHVLNSRVCMRRNRSDGMQSVYQALFIAWNLSSCYWGVDNPRGSGSTAALWRNWLSDVFDHTCGTRRVVGGLSAELKRSDAANAKAAEVAKAVEQAVSKQPATEEQEERLFGGGEMFVMPTRVEIAEPPIFGGPPTRARRRRTATTIIADATASYDPNADDIPF